MPRVTDTSERASESSSLKIVSDTISLHKTALQRTNSSSQLPQLKLAKALDAAPVSGLSECYQEFVKLSACVIFFRSLKISPVLFSLNSSLARLRAHQTHNLLFV